MFHKPVCIRLAALLLVITVARSSAQLPNERPRPEPKFLTYTAEGAGGYAGVVLGLAAGLLAANLTDGPWGTTLVAVGFPAALVDCAGGTYRVGNACRQNRKFLHVIPTDRRERRNLSYPAVSRQDWEPPRLV